MLYGVIDIGSNTVRLTIYDVDDDGERFTTFFKLKTMVGLVSYIDKHTREMSDEGVEKLIAVLHEYLLFTDRFKYLMGPYAFATAGIRNAANAADVIERAEEACGIPIDLISGRDEAELGYAGMMRQSHLTCGVQVDVGGGSTEITTFDNDTILYADSIPYGSLSLFVSHVHDLLPTPAEADRIRAIVRNNIVRIPEFSGFTCTTATGTGGTARASLRLREAWCPTNKHQDIITRKEIRIMLERIFYDPHETIRDILRIAPERIHTCIPGILILDVVMDMFGAKRMEIHEFGVREGYLIDRILSPSPHMNSNATDEKNGKYRPFDKGRQ